MRHAVALCGRIKEVNTVTIRSDQTHRINGAFHRNLGCFDGETSREISAQVARWHFTHEGVREGSSASVAHIHTIAGSDDGRCLGRRPESVIELIPGYEI